jgi:hypothetical protein
MFDCFFLHSSSTYLYAPIVAGINIRDGSSQPECERLLVAIEEKKMLSPTIAIELPSDLQRNVHCVVTCHCCKTLGRYIVPCLLHHRPLHCRPS